MVYYDGSQRKKLRFADIADAKREADLVASKLATGQNDVLRLTSADRAVYVQALDLLRPLGTPLNVVMLPHPKSPESVPNVLAIWESPNPQ